MTTISQGFVFTEEQQAFQRAIRDFCAREVGTREQRDKLTSGGTETHNQEVYDKVAALGWTGISVPEEYGGAGGTLVDECVFHEETLRGLLPIYGAGSTGTVAGCYHRYGTAKQKADVLGAIVEGRVFAISISEPGAGSDVGAISCNATPVEGGFVINGQKTWCSNAHIADRILLVARTSREQSRHGGLTMFEIPTNTSGLVIRGIDTMGGRDVNDLYFTDVFVPEQDVVGAVGKAWPQVMAGLNGERMIGAANALGTAQRAMDDLLSYIAERQQFGRAIGTFQALSHRVADLAIEMECARLLTYDVASRVDANRGNGAELAKLTSMAKVKTSETAKRVALEGMQMMGGYGYAKEYDMEGHVRRSLVTSIWAGTNEIQREIISGSMGLRAR
jgi:alkylation response protein AidB-like acyl-CoA dehydrogenase